MIKNFNKVPLEVQNRSGYDMSHSHLLSSKVGTLTPCLTQRMIPNSTISLGALANVQLPPMASDYFGKVDLRFEAFFVPDRLVWGGYKYFYLTPPDTALADTARFPSISNLPSFHSDPGLGSASQFLLNKFGTSTLSDYLGCKVPAGTSGASGVVTINNVLPFLAYHRIYHDHFRNPAVQVPLFMPPNSKLGGSSVNTSNLCCTPFVTLPSGTATRTVFGSSNDISQGSANSTCFFPDGLSLFDLRQRNWDNDYYTSCTLEPQQGLSPISIPSGTNLTIPQLRQYNASQRFLEKNNITSYDYAAQNYAHYGVVPTHEFDKALYLGSMTVPCYNKTVSQTGATDGETNPFTSIGSQRSVTRAVGDNSLVDSFTCDEHGTFMVIASLVPTAYYSTGSDRIYSDSELGDIPFPEFQGVGDQPVYDFELVNTLDLDTSSAGTFGYTQRYAHFKYHRDEVSGLLSDNASLSCFALKRGFTGSPTLDGSFLQIPTSALDDVSVASASVSQFGWFAEIAFSQKMLVPLSVYSIPTLESHSDTHTVLVDKNGVKYSH